MTMASSGGWTMAGGGRERHPTERLFTATYVEAATSDAADGFDGALQERIPIARHLLTQLHILD